VLVPHRLLVILFILAACAGATSVQPQNPSVPSAQSPSPFPAEQTNPAEDAARAKLERDMAKKANQERQLSLKRDTEKLLKLSTELKEYVDKTNENMLSLDVVKKAEEIEKLARSVKAKMKGN
jgi:uncharacterized protein YkwD